MPAAVEAPSSLRGALVPPCQNGSGGRPQSRGITGWLSQCHRVPRGGQTWGLPHLGPHPTPLRRTPQGVLRVSRPRQCKSSEPAGHQVPQAVASGTPPALYLWKEKTKVQGSTPQVGREGRVSLSLWGLAGRTADIVQGQESFGEVSGGGGSCKVCTPDIRFHRGEESAALGQPKEPQNQPSQAPPKPPEPPVHTHVGFCSCACSQPFCSRP